MASNGQLPATIFGGVYVQSGTEGLGSYHFNETESYISYSAAPSSWRLDDGSPPPMKKPFLNASYDASTRTFRAVVDWSHVNFRGDAKWIYRMVFSDDLTSIEGGEVLSYGAAGEKREWHAYGQDLFYASKGQLPATIFGGVYVQSGTEGLASYHFNETESYISYSAAPSSWRLDDGSPPPVKKPFLDASYVPSTRTFRAIVDWSRVNFSGDAKWIYRMVFSDDLTSIEGGEVLSYGAAGEKRKWHAYGQDLFYASKGQLPATIFGGVYVQSGTEGLASYHFNETESYISYSAAPSSWRLDDGSPPPVKKPFLNASHDASTRTFRAVVDWSHVNFHGDAKWIYRMVFSNDLTSIESGEVLSYGAAGEKREWHAYGQDVFYVRL